MTLSTVINDAPGATLSERIGFTREWQINRARGWLECATAARKAGLTKSAALHLNFAGECRRDAQALSDRALLMAVGA